MTDSNEQSENNKISSEAVLGLSLLFASFPASFLLSLYGLFLYARFKLGYWPSYNNPDPKSIGLHYTLWALLTLLIMPIYLLFFGWIMSRKNQKKYSLNTLKIWIIVAVAWWVIFVICSFDPFSVAEWLLD